MINKIVTEIGKVLWYKDDIIHREDGPAVTFPNGNVQFFLDGKYYRFEKWIEITPHKFSDEEKVMLILEFSGN